MARLSKLVTSKSGSERPLPDWAAEYLILWERLSQSGLVQDFEQRLPLDRTSGYQIRDLLAFMVAYFSSGLTCSVSEFAWQTKKFGPRLAAVAQRLHWPTQGSVSRMLASVGAAEAALATTSLLGKGSDEASLESYEGVFYRDTRGQGWQVFHWDATVTTLRQRGLPSGPELPEPRRYAPRLAAPGYSGRKRGDIQVSRSVLIHAGSGLWRQCTVKPGNSSVENELPLALEAIKAWAQRHSLEVGQCVVCIDGVGQGWTQVRLGTGSPVCFLTRLGKLDLLDDAEVQRRLATGTWERVEDSRSGPVRYALDLGTLSRGSDWQARVVISRFESVDGKKRGAGRVVDGWQYECYATDLPASAFGAPEVVTLYYSRCGQENRFLGEDRELGLDRLFSFHLGGQWLVQALGLWVWNQRVILGARGEGGLRYKLPEQGARQVQVAPPPSPPGQESPCLPETAVEQQAPKNKEESTEAPDAGARPLTAVEQTAPTEHAARQEAPSSQESPAGPLSMPVLLAQGFTLAALENQPGWSFSEDGQALQCPAGKRLGLHDLRKVASGKLELRYRGSIACASCGQRQACSSSQAADFRKEKSFTLEAAPPGQVQQGQSPPQQEQAASSSPELAAETGSVVMGHGLLLPPAGGEAAGRLALQSPVLLPAVLRRSFSRLCAAAELCIEVILPEEPERAPAYVAAGPAARQRRRKTWKERHGWNALPDASEVKLTVGGPPALQWLIPSWGPSQLAA